MHPYNVIRSICEENDLDLILMGGANSEYCTFWIEIKKPGVFTAMYGSCFNEIIILGLIGTDANTFDLHDPESISKIEKYILSSGS